MRLFDSHCHLHFPEYDADRDAVLARMQEKKMGAVLIGTDAATSRAAIDLASKHDFLWASIGLHPNDEKVFDGAIYEELARDPKVVAIGECGLDYFRSQKDGQREKFLQQVDLAEKVQKALVIHCREAHDDMLAILAERKTKVPVIVHFFTGSGELAQKYLDLGCYLSFPGPTTYTAMYDDSIRICPLDRMLIETDAPFAAPVPFRGKRNEPAYVVHVAEKVAQIKGVLTEEASEAAARNAEAVFGLQ